VIVSCSEDNSDGKINSQGSYARFLSARLIDHWTKTPPNPVRGNERIDRA